ncbi:MAG: hypothetical protein ACI841_000337 [Planctomycetota bacterium]|jgi:hypothetical protein
MFQRLRTVTPALLFACVTAQLHAQPTVLVLEDERAEVQVESAALIRALDSINPTRISADLHFIACDEMAGRDSPSKEQRIAARFIRHRLQRLGWLPGAESGYLHEYGQALRVLDVERTKLTASVNGEIRTLPLGDAYAFHPMTLADLSVTGGVVFVGEFDEESLAGYDMKGKWALSHSGSMSWGKRTRLLKEAGACGVLVTSPLAGEDEMGERCGGYAKDLSTPRLSRGSSSSAAYPYVYMSHAGQRAMLELAGLEQMPALGAEIGIQLNEERYADGEAEAKLENVCGFWPGSDPELSEEVIIVSAHYDHVGIVKETGDVFNGADDNGSGTVGMLALAEALVEYGPMRRSVMLIWVSAEEKGLLGSAAWTKDPWLPEGKRPILNLNLDMIGRNAPDQLLITPTKDHEAYDFLTQLAEAHAPTEGFTDLGSADEYWSRSDHRNFYRNLDIPVCFLFTDVHEDYHKPTDTPDKIDYDKLHRVTRLILRMLDGLQGDTLPSAAD